MVSSELARMVTATKAVAAAAEPAAKSYVMFLAGGDGYYFKHVVGWAETLLKAGPAYALVVPVLPDVPEEQRRRLLDLGIIVREMLTAYSPLNQTQFTMACYVYNCSKLRILEVVD